MGVQTTATSLTLGAVGFNLRRTDVGESGLLTLGILETTSTY